MTSSYTTSSTFTITNARYVTSKIAADLLQLRLFYGSPSHENIADYAEEAALLLRDGYLDRVDYGFRRDDTWGNSEWVLLLRYQVRNGMLADDYSGRIPAKVDISTAKFWSYLSYSGTYLNLGDSERARVKAALPIKRSAGNEAGFATGTWSGDRSYSSAQQGVARSVFKAL